jgi:hypothetical protein
MSVNRLNTLHVNVIQGIFLLQLRHQLRVSLQDSSLVMYLFLRICHVNTNLTCCRVYVVTIEGVLFDNRISSPFLSPSFLRNREHYGRDDNDNLTLKYIL